jgi:hypothetical protein
MDVPLDSALAVARRLCYAPSRLDLQKGAAAQAQNGCLKGAALEGLVDHVWDLLL